MIGVEEDFSVVEDHQSVHIAATPQVGGEAGGVLPRQVTQVAESAGQRLQEPVDHLAQSGAQRLWRRT